MRRLRKLRSPANSRRSFDGNQPGAARYSRLPEMQRRAAIDRATRRPRVPGLQAGLPDSRGHPGDADRRGQAAYVSRAQADAQRARRLLQLAWLAVGAYLLGLGIAAVLRTQGDFNIYYRAGARVLHGETIYRLDEANHFLYAPIFAIFFAPFAALPMRAAQLGWYLISAVSIVALIIGSSRMLLGRRHHLEAALIVVPIVLAARFINNNIEHGQINLPTLALAGWAIIFGEEARSVISGAMLAAAILIKPFAILAALFLLLERKLQPILFSIVFGVVMMLAPMAVFDVRGTIDQTAAYLQVVSSMTDRYTLMITNQSASSAIARVMSIG